MSIDEIFPHYLSASSHHSAATAQPAISTGTHLPLRLLQANALLQSTFEGVMITDDQLRIMDVNPAFSAVTGYAATEAIGETPRLLRSGRHGADFYKAMWDTLSTAGRWRGEIWNRRKNGELYPQLLTVTAIRDSDGSLTHYIGVFADVSVLRASEARVEFLTHHDPLTGLANRHLFDHSLGRLLALRHNNEHLQPALFLLDLSRFNAVNQSYGHALGDEVLEQVAQRLQAAVRNGDLVARLAGDEFGVLVSHVDSLQHAGATASKLLAAVQQPVTLGNGEELAVHGALGVAVCPAHGTEAAALMSCAASALAIAKRETPQGYRLYSKGLTRATRERLELEVRLRRAIDNGDIEVFYQPQVAVESGRLIGAEALARWTDGDLGPVPPDRFIPLAEDVGLIKPLGELVLSNACSQWARWEQDHQQGLRLAVNCSSLQLQNVAMAERLLAVMTESGLTPELLELEVTESTVMHQSRDAFAALAHLRGAGVRLAVDDFGTGYSSLAYLRSLHLDCLKIDREFLINLPDDPEDHSPDAAILRAIIKLAHSVGCKVVAEGVERPAQLAFLRQHDCDYYQGWLYSKALPAGEFAALIEAGA